MLKISGKYYMDFIENSTMSPAVQKFWKLAKVWCQELVVLFFYTQCILHILFSLNGKST